MRKFLLATSALVVLGAAPAMALDSETVTVSASVSATCSMTDPDDASFGTDPLVGATDTSNFDFTCNFAGDGGESLGITFASANGGLKNSDDATIRDYSVNYNGNGPVMADLLPTTLSDSSSGAGATNSRAFVVKLEEALPVAGSYSDTLTVSIAP